MILTRSFTRREKVLMLVLSLLLIAGVYVVLVDQPIRSAHAALDSERAVTETELGTATVLAAEYDRMKAELEQILALPPGKLSALPPYDNFQTLMVRFNHIFAGTEPELSFDPVTFTDGVAARTVRFRFTAQDHKKARSVITELTGLGFRCLLDSLDLAPANGDIETDALSVSGTITFYEQAQ
ncbi:MAG: hypothetical protein Q4D31_07460 [Eubacteriales bacterium]|nr:hypothetical protein [Eubacteriales bacterium]